MLSITFVAAEMGSKSWDLVASSLHVRVTVVQSNREWTYAYALE